VTLLQDFLVNGGAGIAVEGASALRRFLMEEYFRRDQVDRLLLLFEDEFGDEAGISRAEFLHWREDDNLRCGLEGILGLPSGTPLPGEEMAGLIATQLPADRGFASDLAERISAYAERAAPLTVDSLKESTGLITDRLGQIDNKVDAVLDYFKDSQWRERERLGEAILRGPLAHANAQELIEEAQRLAESDPTTAAEAMLDACGRLRDAGIVTVAETYEEQAADLLVKAGEASSARQLLMEVAAARLGRGSELARQAVARLKELREGKPEWLDELLEAYLYWPLDPQGAAQSAAAAARGGELSETWFVMVLELLLLLEEYELILELTDEAPSDGELGHRIRLCAAEAGGFARDDDRWQQLLDWAQGRSDPEVAGIVWQRRGHYLAMLDDVEGAVAAYRLAMAAWGRLPGAEEQVAEGYYCILNINLRAGRPTNGRELLPLAADLRGNSSLPGARAERLEYTGMSQLLESKYREALFSYSRSLLIHRRTGSFQGVVKLREQLGELNQKVGEHLAAIAHFLAAGKGKEARRIARECPLESLEEMLALDGPGWRRAAEYSVIAEVGEEMSSDFAAGHLPQILIDAREPFGGFFAPSVSVSGRLALGALALKIEDRELRGRALDLLRGDLEHSFVENTRSAARALALGTELGIWDETERLMDAFLADPSVSGLTPGWAAGLAAENETAIAKLKQGARGGSVSALYALALLELESDDETPLSAEPELVRRCNEHASKRDLKSVRRTPAGSGHTGSVSVGFGTNLNPVGAIANFCDPAVRADLVDGLIELIGSAEEPENHRSSGVAALFQLAPSLGEEQAIRVVAVLRPMAEGSYPASPWDGNNDHPFSAIRVSLHVNESLRAAALQLIAILFERFPMLRSDWLRPLIGVALMSPEPLVVRAGLSAVKSLSALEFLPVVEPHLGADQAQVRADALRAWVAVGQPLPALGLELAEDQAPLVRMTLAEHIVCLSPEQAAEVRAALSADRDQMIRHKAKTAGAGVP
jgi:hypothetical protein